MTPQQLIDMPGAGNAEKWLRKNGKWMLDRGDLQIDTIKVLRQSLSIVANAINDADFYIGDAVFCCEKLTKEATNCN